MNNASGVYLVNGHEQFFESRHTQQSDVASNVVHYEISSSLLNVCFKTLMFRFFIQQSSFSVLVWISSKVVLQHSNF